MTTPFTPEAYRYDGTKWNPLSYPFEKWGVEAFWGAASDDLYAVGTDTEYKPDPTPVGKIMHYDGSSWEQVISDEMTRMQGIWGSAWNDIYAVGGGNDGSSAIWHFDGTAWSKEVPPATTNHGHATTSHTIAMWTTMMGEARHLMATTTTFSTVST